MNTCVYAYTKRTANYHGASELKTFYSVYHNNKLVIHTSSKSIALNVLRNLNNK